MELDGHVQTHYSGNSTISPLCNVLKESYNVPEKLYRCAKACGMDLVTVTDHDSIAGAAAIAHHADVIVGCEITAVFPKDGPRCIGVLGINEEQHRDVQKLRHKVLELMPYWSEVQDERFNHHLVIDLLARLTISIARPRIRALVEPAGETAVVTKESILCTKALIAGS